MYTIYVIECLVIRVKTNKGLPYKNPHLTDTGSRTGKNSWNDTE